ncbi:anti-sigma-D factor RsdA [Gordonia mangrovi]|uniref:anti-sigma-D factor RsdA n=1 Tax=Gordonia mangrovi TaxID=2665643 RepID=UPI001926D49D|nr:anti-sigma-D factor RsdA [Gordonia mangrovi]UVF77332.1 anti-sigma-D factor RsdA [Gordonia mangrovi]
MNDEREPADQRWDVNEPIDMTSVHIDDQFIESLAQDRPVPTRDQAEYELAELLSGWRHEVIAEPPPELPTVDEVESAIAASERAERGRGVIRHLRIASGVAAVVVIACAGLTVLAEGSSPGDPLWGVKKVVFAEAASETQAAMDIQSDLEKAEAAMAAGDADQAAALITKAEKQMGPVRDDDTRNRMNEWMQRLRADTDSALSSASSAAVPGGSSSAGGSAGPSTPPRDLDRQSGSSSVTVTVPSSGNPPATSAPDSPTGQPDTTQPEQPPTPTTTTPTPTAAPENPPTSTRPPSTTTTTTTTTPWFFW